MLKDIIRNNLGNCLTDSSFLDLPNKKVGKVRDIYDLGKILVLVTTDRQSAFDRLLANIPFKGQVLNQISNYWFRLTQDIVPNHVINVPDPNIMVAKKCRPIKVEFVVRGYLTGTTKTSSWMLYKDGGRNLCGNVLPDGMKKNQKFPEPILTPTTKGDEHDEAISLEQIVKRGLLDQDSLHRAQRIVMRLFEFGQVVADQHGLILVDTKYELGFDEKGRLTLIDEIHTPDSSRYWLKNSYEELFAMGMEPENIDKEFLRLWFAGHCDPYKDKVLPQAPEDLVIELSRRYIQLFEMITGEEFAVDPRPIEQRIVENMRGHLPR
jgi:phosphoribosylaminoimidazole-succinocarboxamide synthase